MEIYNPPNIVLPRLTIDKPQPRKDIEDDTTVKNLIRSNLLLDFEFNKLYLEILNKSKELFKTIRLSEDQLVNDYTYHFPPSHLLDSPIFNFIKFSIEINVVKLIMYC